ncbi:hypothetical protein J2752_002409 [Halarchaeum rubridurum]|uniref:Uncharacterized protein n=1 Tax=Halarchaeum rubridurum TaxID=489911 RepID=A0A830G3D3_9EURY|nr:hypothetical protein [Halarchaeum rubridurum]MBP1955486.1 hypothetical protein [Halarchaeum rubridurum]GGM72737.1 hypothetical protein GCM10009017_23380 [Halarchaeum rubridurum]
MAARPPPSDDTDDEPTVVTFGIAAVEEFLDGADFSYPVDRQTVVDTTGDPEVPVDTGGRTLALSTALERTERRRYESRRDLLNALHPVFEEARQSSPGGIVGFVRSLIPSF